MIKLRVKLNGAWVGMVLSVKVMESNRQIYLQQVVCRFSLVYTEYKVDIIGLMTQWLVGTGFTSWYWLPPRVGF